MRRYVNPFIKRQKNDAADAAAIVKAAPQCIGCLRRLEHVAADLRTDLPPLARELCREPLDHVAQLTVRTDALKMH